ncbi:dihydrodipicolinate synthase family protein [Pseudomonas syringae]|uniref:dihydrodipicolinate synthase family protein n=1 Tax=Pseudomonas syringae TaxID=317 RepID=UPI000CD0DD35|nr:dihydrodipicolinate synthase family protein [Pseudomonas syringae]POD27038.1 dihydrodipicolinate synthase family protein [Pseudomonas syringae pv. syringae]
MFTGLSAFPLTPMTKQGIDERAYRRVVERLVKARVDSIGALGSTGSYMYLNREERAQVARLTVQTAGTVPVVIGIGALSTRDVLLLSEDAQKAGAAGVLLAPVSYQKLTEDEVYSLYETVTNNLSVPLVVYDNPGTTNFIFSDHLHGRIAELPNVASIKIPGVPAAQAEAKARVDRLRAVIPNHVTIGVSGDAMAATGLNAGCEVWYSVIGGLFPEITLAILNAARLGNADTAIQLSSHLQPLWDLFKQHGSLRVVAAAAEIIGLVQSPSLPLPVIAVQGAARSAVSSVLEELNLA